MKRDTAGFEKQIIGKIETSLTILKENRKQLKNIKFRDEQDFDSWKRDYIISIDDVEVLITQVIDAFEKELIYLPTC